MKMFFLYYVMRYFKVALFGKGKENARKRRAVDNGGKRLRACNKRNRIQNKTMCPELSTRVDMLPASFFIISHKKT